jgi:hypothetical protein
MGRYLEKDGGRVHAGYTRITGEQSEENEAMGYVRGFDGYAVTGGEGSSMQEYNKEHGN